MNRFARLAAVACVLSLLGFGTATHANAASHWHMRSLRATMYTARPIAVDTTRTARTHMILVKFSNGKTLALPDRLLPRIEQALHGHAYGPADTPAETTSCGDAWVNIWYYNGHPAIMHTGWDSNTPAIWYQWYVQMNGPSYSYSYSAGGDLAWDSTWAGSHHSHTAYPDGWWYATLIHGNAAGGSAIELSDGLYCWPGSDLTDTEYI